MVYQLKLPVGTLSEAKILLCDKGVAVWIEHPSDQGHRPGDQWTSVASSVGSPT